MNKQLVESLRWYATHANHGRGKITGSTAKLAKAGYIAITPTSFYGWTATITAKGREVLTGLQPS